MSLPSLNGPTPEVRLTQNPPADVVPKMEEICGLPVKYGGLVSDSGQSYISVTFVIGRESITRFISMSSSTTSQVNQENKDRDLAYLIEQTQLISKVFINHIMQADAADSQTLINAFKTVTQLTKNSAGEISIHPLKADKTAKTVIGKIQGTALQKSTNQAISEEMLTKHQAIIKKHLASVALSLEANEADALLPQPQALVPQPPEPADQPS